METSLYPSLRRQDAPEQARGGDVERFLYYLAIAGKDRTILLPENLQEELHRQVEATKALHQRELEEGFGAAYIPEALLRIYPNAEREMGRQWLFSAKERSLDP